MINRPRSRAIMVYLVETYGKDDHPLFPKDPKKRALINQRLQYDLGTLYPTFIDQYYLWIFGYAKKTDEKEKRLHDALEFLEIFLKSSDWVAGDSMTLADISLVATISTFEVSGVDLNRHEKVSKWLQKCKTTMEGYKDANQYGVDRFKALVEKKLADSVAQEELVTKDEVFIAIEVLRKAVRAKFIGEEFSDSIDKIDKAVFGQRPFYSVLYNFFSYPFNGQFVLPLTQRTHFINEAVIKYNCNNVCCSINRYAANKKKMDLYYTSFSAPCRSVMLMAEMLGLKLNLIPIDLVTHKHLEKKFTDINPQHILPTLVDDDFVLWESRAIIVYLVQTYGEDNSPLFPEDKKKQALINQRLQFDMGTLYAPFVNQYSPWMFFKIPRTEYKEKKLQVGLKFFEDLLRDSWAAGDSMTVADVALVASISTIKAVGVDLTKYTNISKWFQNCKATIKGYNEANNEGIEVVKTMVANRKLEDKMKLEEAVEKEQSVTNNDVLKAVKTLMQAVQHQVISQEYSEMLQKLMSNMVTITTV
eukprot:XP_016662285.1 PREDICTED: uncharacterized protein LOC100574427 [Acyrthosiphon pisum]